MNFKGAIFDLDGVIVNTVPLVCLTFNNAYPDIFCPISKIYLLSFIIIFFVLYLAHSLIGSQRHFLKIPFGLSPMFPGFVLRADKAHF